MEKPNMDAIRLDDRAFCYKYYRWRIIIPFILFAILSAIICIPRYPRLDIWMMFFLPIPNANWLYVVHVSDRRQHREAMELYRTADPVEVLAAVNERHPQRIQ